MVLSAPLSPSEDGTVYSKRKDFCPFTTPPPDAYAPFVGEEKMAKLYGVARRLKGLKLLEINATAQGGGVAEMLYGAIPFLDQMGIEAEWKIISGSAEFFECTKNLHNLLQGSPGSFTPEMEAVYFHNLERCSATNFIDYSPDVVLVDDPQPLGLVRYLKKPGETWLWRCHIDIEDTLLRGHPSLHAFLNTLTAEYDAAIFTAAHYVVSR